jgi:F-type H+-transporting ATPase subunit b
MELLKPELGLIFWTALIILVVYFLLSKFAWKPILNALQAREKHIDDELKTAARVREEMTSMKSHHEDLLRQAKEERSQILKEAKETKDAIVNEAKDKAREEASKLIAEARKEIDNYKMAALIQVKNDVGNMVVELSEKILQRELQNKEEHMKYVNSVLEKSKLN